jgi:hypothetical protein
LRYNKEIGKIMDYRLRHKVSRIENTPSVGNGLYNIGTGTTDRYSKIWSVDFKGDSTASHYADLAEKYTVDPDVSLPVGTVMDVSQGEFDSEICAIELSSSVIGIISEKPGYVMNENLENAALIGLTGTVPARVVGAVLKKDILVSAGSGCLRAATDPSEYQFRVAVAFESNDKVEEKLVKCIVK